MKFRSKGGFNGSIRDKLFGHSRAERRAKRERKRTNKTYERAYKTATKAAAKQEREKIKKAAKQVKNQAKREKLVTKYAKQIEKMKTMISPETEMGKKMLNKYGIQDLNKWVEDYVVHIMQFVPTIKNMFQRSKNKLTNIDHAVKKYIKNPSVNNLTNLEAQWHKVTNTADREALKLFKQNMAKYLPIGMAVAWAIAADAD